MTGDGRLHDELEALERAAPGELPPRPSPGRVPRWMRLVAPTIVVVATAVIITLAVPSWLRDTIPGGSEAASASPVTEATAATPAPSSSGSPTPQTAASVTLFGHWGDCCYIEGALTYASLSGGPTHRTDEELTAVDTWLIRPGSYELTLYHRPCVANCGNPGGVVGTCTIPLAVDPGASLIVRITWRFAACEATVGLRPAPLPDPALVAGSLSIQDGCVTVTDVDAYRWSVELPLGYTIGRKELVDVIYRPDGSVAAEEIDTVLLLGTTTDVADSGCASDRAYRAMDIGLIRPRAELLVSADTVPPIRPVPQVSCDPIARPAVSTPRCAPAIAAAVRLFTGEVPAISRIEFHHGAYCSPGARCAAPPPNLGYVVIRSADGRRGDLWVSVIADDEGDVTPQGTLGAFPPQLSPP